MERNNNMQTEIVRVKGMNCGGCISTVTHALKAVSGVSEADVSLSAGEATVKFDERLTSREKLKSAVKGAGYGVDSNAAQKPQGKGGCCG